jgi:hypothetical protein
MNQTATNNSQDNSKPVEFKPSNDTDKLALEIATALGEPKKIPLYRMVCENRSEELVRRALTGALKTPQDKVRKSRSAIFFYLLNKYANDQK